VEELSPTRIFLIRRQLVEILISLEDVEKGLRAGTNDQFFEGNKEILQRYYEHLKGGQNAVLRKGC